MALQDDIKRFTLEINESKNNGETLANLQKLETETANLRKENEQLEKVMAYMATTGKKGTDTYKQMEAQLKANRTAITQNSNEIKGLTKNLDLNYMSMNQLKKRSTELASTLNGMSKAANPEEYARLEAELKQVGSAMDNLKGKTDETKGFFGKLDGQLGKVGLSLPTLGWGAAIAGAGAAAKAVYEFVDETVKMRRQVGQLTGETGQDLADLTANIKATADTFGVGFEELAVASNNFAQNMGITNDAANKLINEGFINGANASGEFLAMIGEYGPQLKEAGYSAEEAIGMMSMQVKAGVFTDKGIDVIKEASLRLREMPQSTRDALDAIGISSSEMMQKLSTGQMTVADAIKQVSQKMATLPPTSSAVGTAIADIFGGPGEDAGLAYITMLGTAQEGMEKLGEKTLSQMSTQELMLKSNQDLQKAFSNLVGTGTGGFDRITSTLKILLADGIQGLITGFKTVRDWFIDLYNNSMVFRGEIQWIFLILKEGFELIMLPLKEAWNTVKGIFNVVGALLTGRIKDIPNIIKETVTKSKDIAVSSVKKMAGNVKDAWNNTLDGKINPPTVDPEKQAAEQKKQETKAYVQAQGVGAAAKKAKDEAAKKALDDLDKQQQAELTALKKSLSEQGVAQDQLNAYVEAKEIEHLTARMALQKKFGQDVTDTEKTIVDKQIKIREDFEKRRSEIDKAIAKAKEEADKAMADFDKEQEKEFADAAKEEQDAAQKKFERYEELRKTFQSTEKTDREEMLKQLSDLEEAYKAKGILSEEEYEAKKLEIAKAHLVKRLDEEEKFLTGASQVADAFSAMFSAQKNAELAKVGENEAAKAAINKKYAKKEQNVAAAQAGIAGALAIMRIWKGEITGNPVVDTIIKIALTTAQAATTVAQVKQIKSQQFAEGRYPVRGASDGRLYSARFLPKARTGIYSEPTLSLFSERQPEAVIDGFTTQRLMWNYPHIWNGITTLASGGVPQFATGRYPASATSVSGLQSPVTVQSDPALTILMQQNAALMQHLATNGIRATANINSHEVFNSEKNYSNALDAFNY